MSAFSDRFNLKIKLITIYKNYDSFDLLSLYRNLLKYNNDIRKYILNNDLYEKYIIELYNIIDEYAYGNDDIDEITKIRRDFNSIIIKIINEL